MRKFGSCWKVSENWIQSLPEPHFLCPKVVQQVWRSTLSPLHLSMNRLHFLNHPLTQGGLPPDELVNSSPSDGLPRFVSKIYLLMLMVTYQLQFGFRILQIFENSWLYKLHHLSTCLIVNFTQIKPKNKTFLNTT